MSIFEAGTPMCMDCGRYVSTCTAIAEHNGKRFTIDLCDRCREVNHWTRENIARLHDSPLRSNQMELPFSN